MHNYSQLKKYIAYLEGTIIALEQEIKELKKQLKEGKNSDVKKT